MPPETVEPRTPRLAFLDGMRALAAVYVVLFHVLGLTGHRLTGAAKVLKAMFAFGHEAVAIFIVLSGYCLMLPVARSGVGKLPTSVGTFLWRRAFRILPPYYAAMGLSLLLLWAVAPLRVGGSGGIWDETLPGLEPFAIATHLLLVHNWLPSVAYQINGPHWSVATELQIYVVYSLALLPLFRALKPLKLTLLTAVVGYAPLLFAPAAAAVAAPWYLVLFVFGMWAAVLGTKQTSADSASGSSWLRSPGLALALVVACAALGLGAARVWFRYKPATDALVGGATTLMLLQISAARAGQGLFGWLRKLLESRVAVRVGQASYSLYLTHLPVLALCELALRPLTPSPGLLTLLLLGVGTACSLLVAFAFHYLVEQRFIRAPRPAADHFTAAASRNARASS